jgi:hypothetical protein
MMASKHTGNVTFHSKSNSIGSVRWQFTAPPVVPRGYIIDMGWSVHHPLRWYAVALVCVSDKYYLCAYRAGNEAECSLDDADLKAVLSSEPIFTIEMPGVDEAEALSRMERGASNVMHGKLDIGEHVRGFWEKIAQRDGTVNIWG